ncbi:MAG: SDR family oxidoreductase [Thalassolituus maritimus]|uniref:NAD(P)H dehydrogenase (Quinone) n=1 Tax=Thalassolituus maritimus TaxID=484498 RepID=A0A1N7MKK2_9GAMM|nr:SDR family oxidoreductase [Thalassolituus maritimus]TPD55821.1 MAG: SDR family oxidoreductase [Thalassolituus maritimus]SIS86518.1 NAD(P)H dehydrogenase (quinone) [Thalassolituus maritimus]
MIAITGASGQLGRLVIDELLTTTPASEITALVRTPESISDLAERGITVRQADYNEPGTLIEALKGIKKLLLISSSEVGQRAQQHQNVINAAKENGIGLIAYTSILHADTSPLGLAEEHRATEAMLSESGIPFALLRNGWYSENYTAGIPAALQLGTLYGCAGDGLIASAARADYAAAAAKVITLDNQGGKIYELSGDKAYTLAELAAKISQQTGKEIGYVNLPEADYASALEQAGLPAPLAHMLADSDTGASQGGLYDNSQTLSGLIGRPTTPIAESVKEALKGG